MNRKDHRTIVLAGLALALACAVPGIAQERADDADRKSKNGLTEGTVAGAEVKVTYGRPEVRGRTIWGELVPWGQIWRAGADEATTVTFSKAVKIGGQEVPAGTYALFVVPEKDEWTFVLNKNPKQWGAYNYKESEDLLRVPVKPATADHAEQLTFELSGDAIWLHWGEMKAGLPVNAG